MTTVSYAQNMEDVVLLRALKDIERGFYVDVGAWSPVEDSVTKLFYDRGWSGINIEPVQHWHARLEQERPRDVNLRVAAGARPGRTSIHVVGETGLSTVSDELSAHYTDQGFRVADERVEVRTLDSVLDEFVRGDIHFLKLDTEGAEKDVLAGLDLARHRPWILVIESGAPGTQIESHAVWEPGVLEAGYAMVYADGLNRFYLASERESLREAFRYPPNVFDDYVQHRYDERLQWYADRVAEIQALADARGEQVDAFADRLHWYATHIEEVQALADARQNQVSSCLQDVERIRAGTQQLLDRIAPACQAEEGARPGEAQLFVDVTMLAASDAGTGIQRVVRNIVAELLRSKPEGFEVTPVRFVKGSGYVHAQKFRPAGSMEADGDEQPIRPLPGDLVLGLDLIADILPDHREYFEWLRKRGAALWFVVYDLLPVLRPEFFPRGALGVFQRWYAAIADLATGVVCISESVADEYKRWLDQIQPRRETALQLGYFHLGADMDHGMAAAGSTALLRRDQRMFLMVGTVEVRKGHGQVLDAFETLWAHGVEAKLLIIGKPGWLSDDVITRLRELVTGDGRVQWMASASDAELLEAYSSAGALIMASEGEGYGLPIVEAALHGLPVIARDLPVFREVARDGALYFDGTGGDVIADAIEKWMHLAESGSQPSPNSISRTSWQESTQQLLRVVRYGAQGQWHAGTEYAFDAMHPAALTIVGRHEKGAIVADGRSGYLVYGPYSSVAAGRYQVSVRLEARSSLPAGSVLDVVAGEAESPLHRIDLQELEVRSGQLEIEFPLLLDEDVDRFQIRIFVGECAEVRFMGSTLVPQGLGDTYTRAIHAEAVSVAARKDLAAVSEQLAYTQAASEAASAEAKRSADALAETAAELRQTHNDLAVVSERLAEAIAALRQAHTQGDALRVELGRVDSERARWRDFATTMENSRSWKVTGPLRRGRAAASKQAARVVSTLRPLWHVAVRSKWLAAITLSAARPVPPLHARLRRSIAYHHQMQLSPPNSISRDTRTIGPRAAYAYSELVEARKLVTVGKDA